jgi:hypothetical protein
MKKRWVKGKTTKLAPGHLLTEFDLVPAEPGFWSWCEELGRHIWVDTSRTRIGTPDADAPKNGG